MPRIVLAAVSLPLMLGIVACATQRADGTKVEPTVNITVTSEPEGARCVLARAGQEIGVIESAPKTVAVDRSSQSIIVTCEKDAHITSIALVEAVFVPGNARAPGQTDYSATGTIGYGVGLLILGAIVRGSSANYSYPDVTLTLQANRFASAAERDAKYEELKAAVNARFTKKLKAMEPSCRDNTEQCRIERGQLEKERDAEMIRLESFKASASVGLPALPLPPPNKAALQP